MEFEKKELKRIHMLIYPSNLKNLISLPNLEKEKKKKENLLS